MDVLIISIWTALVCLLIYCISLGKKLYRMHTKLRLLPSPKREFLLWHIRDLISGPENLFPLLREWGLKYSPVYTLGIFPVLTINCVGPYEVERIVSTPRNSQKSAIYQLLNRWLREGLLTSFGNKWQTRRKLLTPAFHFTILQDFISIFYKETNHLVEDFKLECDKPVTDLVPLVTKFTLKTINETSMGTTLDLDSKKGRKYKDALKDIGHLYLDRLTKPWLYPHYIYYYLTSTGRKERKTVKNLQKFTKMVIDQKIQIASKPQLELNGNSSYSKRKYMAMLDLLINIKNSDGTIDAEGIAEEVDTFMFEGHDTTAMALSFGLMLIANHRDVQELLLEEIQEVLGDVDEQPTYTKLNDLKYMDRVIKECLRLYPSVPFISRVLDEDIVTSKGHFIPKDTIANIHVYDLHRSPELFPEPDKFDPDRFLPENAAQRHPFAYIPFSAGPRNCIGQKFAMLELKTALSGIIKNFILEPVHTPENLPLMIDIILRPKDGIKVKFTKRNP